MNFLEFDLWSSILQIIIIDLLLSGDNAIIIALACKNLSPEQRKIGIFWGIAGAIFMRIALTFFALTLLKISFIKIIGGVLLIWIGIKLILPDKEDKKEKIKPANNLKNAVYTIIIADVVMSLDNVVAVAAAAKDNVYLLIFGLALSIPIMIWASRLILKIIDNYPIIIKLGGALLGWIAVSMVLTDPFLEDYVLQLSGIFISLSPILGALFVILVGFFLEKKQN